MSSLSNAAAAPQKMHLLNSVSLTTTELQCYAFCYYVILLAWYIFTSAFFTSSVILEACSPPPRPEWFYMHASASSTVHSESIIRSWSCCPTFPPLVMAHLWRNASCVRAGWEVEVVTLVPATGTQHRDPDRDQDSRATRILSATVTRQQGRGSDQTIHL